MGSVWGNSLKITIFGESHGVGIGTVIDGFPAGMAVDFNAISREMARRAPSGAAFSTKRKEADVPEILSGIFEGRTTGAPICAMIVNSDAHSSDYRDTALIPRPGHADYPAYLRYRSCNDYRGGGHFSGRLTAPLVFAGVLCKQLLSYNGIGVGAHIRSIGDVSDEGFDPCRVDAALLKEVTAKTFPILSDTAGEKMGKAIEKARMSCDSIGGVIECAAVGVPGGLGSPMFRGVEQILSSILFSIPAVKGVEFGDGFALSHAKGSEANDEYYMDGGAVKTATNHNGGILGGITSGMPVIFRVAVKPTPSIAREQCSVNLQAMEDTSLAIKGRHDSCIVPRAVPVVEAACALAFADLLLEAYGYENIATAKR